MGVSDNEASCDGTHLPEAAGESPWRVAGCLVLLLVAVHVVVGPKARISEWKLTRSTGNTNFLEALAWYDGRLDIQERVWDSALYQGRVYSVNPPLFTFLAYGATVLAQRQGHPVETFYTPWYVELVALPLPLLGFWALVRATGKASWAALLTLGWMAGTPVIACLAAARIGGIHHINHLLSQTGLMLIAISLLGRRRIAGALVGLVIAVWSRPTTIAFAVPVLWAAWQWDVGWRRRRMIAAVAALVVTLAVPMVLNALKFGSPFDSGYTYVYEGRIDEMAQRGRSALFSPEFIGRNIWFMNFELPGWEMGKYGIRPVLDSYGASIWFTTPLLLFVIYDARRWWRDKLRQMLMLASFLVIAGLICYHNTGYCQPGYYRYMLDYAPIWLVVIAPQTMGPRRSWLTVAAIAWSVLYFNSNPTI